MSAASPRPGSALGALVWEHPAARSPASAAAPGLPPQLTESPALCCRNSNAAFHEALKEIEKRPACGGLPMISFLILPMQRVTRLPLLTDVSMPCRPLPGEGGRPGAPLQVGTAPHDPLPVLLGPHETAFMAFTHQARCLEPCRALRVCIHFLECSRGRGRTSLGATHWASADGERGPGELTAPPRMQRGAPASSLLPP